MPLSFPWKHHLFGGEALQEFYLEKDILRSHLSPMFITSEDWKLTKCIRIK